MENNDIKLTLDFEEETSLTNIVEEKKEMEPIKKEIEFTEEENKQVEEFASKIDITNSNLVLRYGANAQNKIASFSEKTLEQVRNKDIDEVGKLLTDVVNDLKSFDVEEKSGIMGLFKKGANKFTELQTKYQSVETNVESVKKNLENHQITLLKDIALLDQMYELNRQYYKELSMYIEAGNRKLNQARNEELVNLQNQANTSALAIDSQRVRDYSDMINRFEKKIHDLELTKMISIQMAPQIRMVQSSNTVMVEKIQSTIVNTIPLWKSQMVLALSADHSLKAAEAQKEVTDFTNALLKKNADTLKTATINTAKESERGIVDIDTIKYTNQKLIEALNEVRTIQIEGSKKREEASRELTAIEGNLKQSLLDTINRK